MPSLIKNHKENPEDCLPDDIALKSFFLGPQAENADWLWSQMSLIFKGYSEWRRSLYPSDGTSISEDDQNLPEFKNQQLKIENLLSELAKRFESEIPKFSPRYIAHMFSETSMPAFLGHILTLLHNPNNISGESSKVGVKIEREAIIELALMLGYTEQARGHFTSGGTLANFEALYRAKKRMYLWLNAALTYKAQGKWDKSFFESAHMGWKHFQSLSIDTSQNDFFSFEFYHQLMNEFQLTQFKPLVFIPENKHYSWVKALDLMGMSTLNYCPVALDAFGRLSIKDLKEKMELAIHNHQPILMVVSVAGSTELGNIDPIDEVSELLEQYLKKGIDIWHHVDAAYGGFFCSLKHMESEELSKKMCLSLQAIAKATSITVDPHKLGYVPYASGTFLVQDVLNYRVTAHLAPYIDYQSENDLGLFTLEGSRSAAGAVATWLTAKSIGLNEKGYGTILLRQIKAKKKLELYLKKLNPSIRILNSGDTNVLCLTVAKPHEKLSVTNKRVYDLYQRLAPQNNSDFFISKTVLYSKSYKEVMKEIFIQWQAIEDQEELFLIRLCVLNPFIDSKQPHIRYLKAFSEKLNREIILMLNS